MNDTERTLRATVTSLRREVEWLTTRLKTANEKIAGDQETISTLEKRETILQNTVQKQHKWIEWAKKTIGPKQFLLPHDPLFIAGQSAFVKLIRMIKNPTTNVLEAKSSSYVFHHHSCRLEGTRPIIDPRLICSDETTTTDATGATGATEGDEADCGTSFIGVLGATLHQLKFTQPRSPYSTEHPEPEPTLASLQKAFLNDRQSYLLIMLHAMASGLAKIPTRTEYIHKPWEHRRALVYAGIAASMVEVGCHSLGGSTIPPPYQIFNRDTLEAQRHTSVRLLALNNRLGTTLTPTRVENYKGTINAKKMYQYLPWVELPPGCITRYTIDNCNSTRTTPDEEGSFGVNLTSVVTSVFTREDQQRLGMLDHLSEDHPYRLRAMDDFTKTFEHNSDFHTQEASTITLDKAGVERMNCGFELIQQLNAANQGSGWVEEVNGCVYTKKELMVLAKKWKSQGIENFSLPMAFVKGSKMVNGHDLPPGWKDNLPQNERMKCAYLRRNAVISTDVGHFSVDNVEENTRFAQFAQYQIGVGPLDHYSSNILVDPRSAQWEGREMEEAQYEQPAWMPPSKACIGSDMQPIAQLHASMDCEAEEKTEYIQDKNGNLHTTFGGMHLLKEFFKIFGGLFDRLFLRSLISVVWPKEAEQDYFLYPRDHRKAKETWPQLAMGFTLAQIIEYVHYIKTSGDFDDAQIKQKLENLSHVNVKGYIDSFNKKRPSNFVIQLFLRANDILGLTRVSGKTCDFHLYRQCSDLAMPFLTTGNATVYIRVMVDEKIYLATCSQFDFLIRSGLTFCVLSANGNWIFMDKGQEINVSGLRQVHQRDDKKFTKKDEAQLRQRYNNLDHILYTRRNGMLQLGEEENEQNDISSAIDATSSSNTNSTSSTSSTSSSTSSPSSTSSIGVRYSCFRVRCWYSCFGGLSA